MSHKYHIPQIIFLSLTFINLLLDANRHGKKREKTENIWISLIATAITTSILYWGGFFN
jgi:hypothetical protein